MSSLKRTALLALAFLAGCTTPAETLFVPLESANWSLAHEARGSMLEGRPGIREFVPVGEDLESWSRLLTVQNWDGDRRAPWEVVSELRDAMLERCPDATWEVLEGGPDSVVYEWRIEDCGDHDDQHEVARMVRGNLGLHRVALTAKGGALDPELRASWLEIVGGAFVLDLVTGAPAEVR